MYNQIEAIKIVRQRLQDMGLAGGLKESKDLVEAISKEKIIWP